MAIDAALGRLGNKSGVCTSSTRPTNPFEGQLIYETDTNRTLVYDNSAWVVIANASATNFPGSLDTNTVDSIAALQAKVGVDSSAVTTSLDYLVNTLPAGLLAQDTNNADVTCTTSGVTLANVSVTLTTSRKLRIIFYVPTVDLASTNMYVLLEIRDSAKGSGTGYQDGRATLGTTIGSNAEEITVVHTGTFAAGTHDFYGTITTTTGTCRANNQSTGDAPRQIELTVEDLGAA